MPPSIIIDKASPKDVQILQRMIKQIDAKRVHQASLRQQRQTSLVNMMEQTCTVVDDEGTVSEPN